MTTTSTTDLADILSAKKADLVAPIVEVHEYVVTGEIVPAPAAAVSPMATQGRVSPPSSDVAAAPAPVEIRYPEIPPKVVGGLPYIRDYVKLARTIDQTEMVPVAFRGRYDAITAAFMRGYELGLGPMQALDSFNVIEGKVGLSAEAMRALIMQAGHLFILSEEPGVAYVTCRRSDWPEDIPSATYRYDMDDAKIAGLLGPTRSGKPSAWDKNPRAMLAARATSGAGRAYFADVLAGMSYTPEEIRDFSGPEQEVTPSPPTTTASTEAPASAPALSASAPSETPPVPSMDTTPSSGPSEKPPAVPASSIGQISEPASLPKKPRGRPRKAQSAPIAAPGPSVPESSTTAPENELTIVPSTPPELTSLNSPGEIGVTREMLRSLTAIIKGLPQAQQVLCRSFIRQHYPEGTADLTPADVQKCIDIAAGWPDSADQHPVPVANEPLPF